MQAQDILPETRKLEESGMERSWAEAVAETIVKAVEPLASKEDLKAESEALRKDFKSEILSLKVWLLVILLGMWGSLSALILYTQRTTSPAQAPNHII